MNMLRLRLIRVLLTLVISMGLSSFGLSQLTRQYSSYYGGSGNDEGYGVTVMDDGTAFYVGTTQSSNFPASVSALQRYYAGGDDVFVTAVAKTGEILWSTHLGSSARESDAWGITSSLDGAFIYVAFRTSAPTLPIVGPTSYQSSARGNGDIVLVKLRRNGALAWATFYGGNGEDTPVRINATDNGGVVVAGQTFSSNLVTRFPHQAAYGGAGDGFYAWFSATGGLLRGSYVGGPAEDILYETQVVPGNIFSVGLSNSGFLSSPKRAYAGNADLFVLRSDINGTQVYGTYLGGSGSENVGRYPGVVVDAAFNAYVAGSTSSSNFPAVNAVQGGKASGADGVVAAFNPTGDLLWSTYLGGSGNDELTSISLQNDLLYIGGTTGSAGLSHITTATAAQAAKSGGSDGLLVAMRTSGTVAYATYYGGSSNDEIRDLHVRDGFVAIAGPANAGSLSTQRAAQSSNAGGADAQLAMFQLGQLGGTLLSVADATSCTRADGSITLQLDASLLGSGPYDVSLDAGATWDAAQSALVPNAARRLVVPDLLWGSYEVSLRDAVGRIHRVGPALIGGCVYEVCPSGNNNRLTVPAISGATRYTWTTTLGTIGAGQNSRTMWLNLGGVSPGATGTVCMEPSGPSCGAPQICVKILFACPAEICDNGIDDDGDGKADCDDDACPKALQVRQVGRE